MTKEVPRLSGRSGCDLHEPAVLASCTVLASFDEIQRDRQSRTNKLIAESEPGGWTQRGSYCHDFEQQSVTFAKYFKILTSRAIAAKEVHDGCHPDEFRGDGVADYAFTVRNALPRSALHVAAVCFLSLEPEPPCALRPETLMPFELFLALRYLVARRKQAFLSLDFGHFDGGGRGWRDGADHRAGVDDRVAGGTAGPHRGASPHIYVWHVGEGLTDVQGDMRRLKQVPRVTGASPIVLGKALVTAGERQAFITVKGIDPATEGEVTDVRERMRTGSLSASHRAPRTDWPASRSGKRSPISCA